MTSKPVTILIPNYKTPEVTKICLRLIRKHTKPELANVIVIDNDSRDESTEYLRNLKWVDLVERESIDGESGVQAHSRALDEALKRVNTPFVLSIHSDTFVKRSDWLQTLMAQFDEYTAGVGSWKLEAKSIHRKVGIHLEQRLKFLFHKLFGYKNYKPHRLNKNAQYLRSHCAMYRTEVIRKLNTGFSDGNDTAGKTMHYKMHEAGYKMHFLSSHFLGKYVDHLNHATSIFNPELRRSGQNTKKDLTKIRKKLRGIKADVILNDGSLDY